MTQNAVNILVQHTNTSKYFCNSYFSLVSVKV
jgi:hypothetical protein